VIYFIQAGEQRGPIKIGHTEGPHMLRSRLNVLQIGNPEVLHLVTTLPGGLERERVLHERFAAGHMRGEWFRWDTPGLQEFIYEAVQAEAEQLVAGLRYCAWCHETLVRPPRTKLCSDACEREKKRATSRTWKEARR
jgi:hypothetical protein